MLEIYSGFLPVFAIAILGYLLKRIRIIDQHGGDFLIKLIFYLAVPGLILKTYSSIELTGEFILLPLVSGAIIFLTSLLVFPIASKIEKNRQAAGVFLIGTLIINNNFILPFVIQTFGDAGVARLIMFDFTNGILVFTYIYFIACKFGENSNSKKTLAVRLLKSPPVWALLAGILINLTDWNMPPPLYRLTVMLGDLTAPLILLTLGIFFTPRILKVRLIIISLFLRMAGGLAIGLGLTYLLGIEGLSRTIVLLGSAAPVGYNTLTFSALENLDREFAASLVSWSVLTGMITTPLLIHFFG